MNLYIKQKVMSWKSRFNVYNAEQETQYTVEGKMFSFSHQLTISNGMEDVGFVRQKLLTFLPKYFIQVDQKEIELKQNFTFFKKEFELPSLGWMIHGDFMDHNYDVTDENGITIMIVQKKWFTWGDTYEIHFEEHIIDPVLAVAIVVTIDAILSDENSSSNSSSE